MNGQGKGGGIEVLRNEILIGDALATLRSLPSESVDMIFTSPPYYGLRDYGIGSDHGEIGCEKSVHVWVENLAKVCSEARRVLNPTGTMWINVGDTYSAGQKHGAPRKSLLLAPGRLALRLVEDGWILRNWIIWAKANHLPHPVADRLTPAHEPLLMFAKEANYYFDLDAIRVPHTSKPPGERLRRTAARAAMKKAPPPKHDGHAGTAPRGRSEVGAGSHRRKNASGEPTAKLGSAGLKAMRADGRVGHPLGKNPGDVWRLPVSNYHGAHRATTPLELAKRAIAAACPRVRSDGTPGIVLDPFMGSGTTGVAAKELGRDWVGVELNADYAKEAAKRISEASPTTHRSIL